MSHRDPGAVSGVGDADLQLLRSPAHLPCIGQGLAGELLADPGRQGQPWAGAGDTWGDSTGRTTL